MGLGRTVNSRWPVVNLLSSTRYGMYRLLYMSRHHDISANDFLFFPPSHPHPPLFLIIIIIFFFFFLVLFVSKFVHPTPTFLSFDSDMTRSDATPTRLDPI